MCVADEDSLPLPLFYLALIFLAILIVANPDQQYFTAIILQTSGIPLRLNLLNDCLHILLPFQLNEQDRYTLPLLRNVNDDYMR